MVKNNAKHVVVFGIADDFCVKDTSIGLNDIEVLGLKQTFSKITYLHDISYGIVREIRGTAGGGDGDDAGLRSEYEAAGVEVSDSAKVLQDLREEFYTERGGGRRNEL